MKLARQQGAVLITGLTLLIVLSLLALAGARSSVQQEKMAGNVRRSNTAFQTAEAVLREAEAMVRAAAESGTLGSLAVDAWSDAGLAIFDCAAKEIVNDPDVSSWPSAPSGQGRYLVVEMSSIDGRAVACRPLEEEAEFGAGNRSSYYMILAHAEGPAEKAASLVTSAYYYED